MTKELKARIRTLQSTHKITSAMKVVSATAFNRLKTQISHKFDFLNPLIQLKRYVPETDRTYTHQNLLIVIGGDRGLCGGYNAQIRAAAQSFMRDFPDSHIGYIGIKSVLKGHVGIFKETIQSLKDWSKLSDVVSPLSGQYAHVRVVYMKFKSLYDQVVELEEVYNCHPHEREDPLNSHQKDDRGVRDNIINEITTDILPLILTAQVMKALIHAQLCEFSTRMLSMDNATQNADKMIEELQTTSNKLRQANITKELSETVAGSSV